MVYSKTLFLATLCTATLCYSHTDYTEETEEFYKALHPGILQSLKEEDNHKKLCLALKNNTMIVPLGEKSRQEIAKILAHHIKKDSRRSIATHAAAFVAGAAIAGIVSATGVVAWLGLSLGKLMWPG